MVKRVQSTNSHDWLFGWLIIQQWFDNDCLINQLAWWLFDNDWATLIIHSSSQSSPINQLAWLIIRVIDYSTMIRQWLFNQPARVIDRQWLSHMDYSWLINQLIKLIIHSSSQASPIHQLAWLIIRVIDYSAMIRQWLFNQPARVIDYLTMIESHWLFVINQLTHQID